MSGAGFDPVKHGPAVWALQGLKWREAEMGAAKVFKGWSAERLAGVLGLEVGEVARVLAGEPAPAPVPPVGRPAAPSPAPAPSGPELPPVGSCWEARRLLTAWAYPRGGFTLDPAEVVGWGAALGRGSALLSPSDLIRVEAHAGPGHVVLRVDSPHERAARFVRLPVSRLGGLLRPC